MISGRRLEKILLSLESVFLSRTRGSRVRKAQWFWGRVVRWAELLASVVLPNGMERTINGVDVLRLPVRFRYRTYEPEVWLRIMAQVRPGDIIADVGAYVGLYTIAFAKRTGVGGRVVAFEPHPNSLKDLCTNVRLNRLQNVDVVPMAVGAQNCEVSFVVRDDEGSYVVPQAEFEAGASRVPQVTLDSQFAQGRLNVLKMDVEGYELEVLRGGVTILCDARRGPRSVCIEVHPVPLRRYGGSGREVVNLLASCGYRVQSLQGEHIDDVVKYTHILAARDGPGG